MRLPILEIPQEIHGLCSNYKDNFSVPQFKNFERFVTGIIVNDKADIWALSQGFNLGKHYDSLHHFVSLSSWDIEDIFKTSISVIKHLQEPARRFSQKGYLLIDDSLIEKFGKFMEAVGKLYDHSKSRYLEYAHCLVVLIYVDHHGNRYPLRFDLYRKEEDCQKINQPFRTKIEIAKELISYAINQGIPFQGVIFDSWYFSKDLVDFIEGFEKDWITQARNNRLVVHQGEKIPLDQYAQTLANKRRLEKIEVGKHCYRYQSVKLSMPSLKRGKQKVRLIVSYQYDDHGKLKDEPIFLFSNRKDWRVERILRAYQMRWAIETYFKDAKHHLGLKDYQVRGLKGIKSHWCLVFTSAIILELMRARCVSEKGFENLNLSVRELCQRAFNQALHSIIRWVIEQVKNLIPEQQIFSMLGA